VVLYDQARPKIRASHCCLLLHIFLTVRFGYVNNVLRIHKVYKELYPECYPTDELVKSQIAYEQKWFDFATILVLARMMCRSEIIPWHRKLFIFIILPYFTYKPTRRGLRRMRRGMKRSVLGLWGGV